MDNCVIKVRLVIPSINVFPFDLIYAFSEPFREYDILTIFEYNTTSKDRKFGMMLLEHESGGNRGFEVLSKMVRNIKLWPLPVAWNVISSKLPLHLAIEDLDIDGICIDRGDGKPKPLKELIDIAMDLRRAYMNIYAIDAELISFLHYVALHLSATESIYNVVFKGVENFVTLLSTYQASTALEFNKCFVSYLRLLTQIYKYIRFERSKESDIDSLISEIHKVIDECAKCETISTYKSEVDGLRAYLEKNSLLDLLVNKRVLVVLLPQRVKFLKEIETIVGTQIASSTRFVLSYRLDSVILNNLFTFVELLQRLNIFKDLKAVLLLTDKEWRIPMERYSLINSFNNFVRQKSIEIKRCIEVKYLGPNGECRKALQDLVKEFDVVWITICGDYSKRVLGYIMEAAKGKEIIFTVIPEIVYLPNKEHLRGLSKEFQRYVVCRELKLDSLRTLIELALLRMFFDAINTDTSR